MDSSVARHLREFVGEEIIYIPNPGNAGDSLIAAATYQLFDQLGLTYVTPRFQHIQPRNRIVIYGGGGNLVSPGTFSGRLCRELHKEARRLIILPHTIKNVSPLLQAFGPNVDVFCRERTSYEYVSSQAKSANTFLADDMAIGLRINDPNGPYPGQLGGLSPLLIYVHKKLFTKDGLPSLSNVLRATRRKSIRERLERLTNADTLFCFRTDPEKSQIPIPENNVDVSEVFRFGVSPRIIAYLAAYEVFRFLGRFETIHTNRLHMAIGGALAGCQVKFYENNYYKCRAVYLYSLAGRFPNVEWMSQGESSLG